MRLMSMANGAKTPSNEKKYIGAMEVKKFYLLNFYLLCLILCFFFCHLSNKILVSDNKCGAFIGST